MIWGLFDMNLILISLALAASFLIILFKVFGVKRTLKYHLIVDVVAMIGVPILSLGSFDGLVVAIYSGIIISAALFLLRLVCGVKEDAVKDLLAE